MKKNTLFKRFTKSFISFILIIIIYIYTNIYELFNLFILYCKIKFICKNIDIKFIDKLKLIKIILKYIFIHDIKVSRESICILNKNNYDYEAILNNKYFMIINLNSQFVLKYGKYKEED